MAYGTSYIDISGIPPNHRYKTSYIIALRLLKASHLHNGTRECNAAGSKTRATLPQERRTHAEPDVELYGMIVFAMQSTCRRHTAA